MKDDLIGQTFGQLTVIQDAGRYPNGAVRWYCECICGGFTYTTGRNLKSGHTKSCGCLRIPIMVLAVKKDLTGKRFGRLLVIKEVGRKWKETSWLCQCDCGNTLITTVGSLMSDNTQSCGCLRLDRLREKIITHGLSKTKEYRSHRDRKRRILSKGLDKHWTLEMEVCLKRLFISCVICGSKERLCVDHVYPLSKGNGLRPGNAVILCTHCNSKKWKHNPIDLPEVHQYLVLKSAAKFKQHWEGVKHELGTEQKSK